MRKNYGWKPSGPDTAVFPLDDDAHPFAGVSHV